MFLTFNFFSESFLLFFTFYFIFPLLLFNHLFSEFCFFLIPKYNFSHPFVFIRTFKTEPHVPSYLSHAISLFAFPRLHHYISFLHLKIFFFAIYNPNIICSSLYVSSQSSLCSRLSWCVHPSLSALKLFSMDVGLSFGKKRKSPSSHEKKEIPLFEVASNLSDIFLELLRRVLRCHEIVSRISFL